ncbi:unnamed protein product [Camellia sinensis]
MRDHTQIAPNHDHLITQFYSYSISTYCWESQLYVICDVSACNIQLKKTSIGTEHGSKVNRTTIMNAV